MNEPISIGSGVNQSGSRAYNERLMLTLLRQYGALSKAELARLTGLTAQTLSVIIKHLEEEGLVLPQQAQRGRVGQPSIPYALNPSSIHALGVKIGRRSTQIVLCDFLGAIQAQATLVYAFPIPGEVFAFIAQEAARYPQAIGLGIAMPFEIWLWENELNLPPFALEAWKNLEVQSLLAAKTGMNVLLANDATAACAAQLIQLKPTQHIDFLYFYIDWFVGGGVVLNGSLYEGRTGNAGAVGSLPLTPHQQLIETASLLRFEKILTRQGKDVTLLSKANADWDIYGEALETWLKTASLGLAQAIAAGLAIIDFPQVYIDGILPNFVRESLVSKTRQAFAQLNTQGLSPVTILEGKIGPEANAIGAAMMPILAAYSTERKA